MSKARNGVSELSCTPIKMNYLRWLINYCGTNSIRLKYWTIDIVDFHAEYVERWSKATRKAKLTMLDNAQHFYETQRDLWTKHQLAMDD